MPGVGPFIDSPRHPRIVAARRLHRRSSREEERLFLVEGRQAVAELVAFSTAVEVFATPEAAERNADILGGQSVSIVSDRVAAALSDTVTPQGLVAVAPLLDTDLASALPPSPRLVAVLVDVRDPGNVGTIIRVADAAGADAVVLAGDSVDPHNGKCVRAAAGSHFHLPVVQEAEVAQVVVVLRERGLRVLAADGGSDVELPTVVAAGVLNGPVAWIFGNEAHGLDLQAKSLADEVIRIPIYGKAESLNLAAAATLCLYAAALGQPLRPTGP